MNNNLQVLWDDGERILCRGPRPRGGGNDTVLLARPAAERPSPASLDRLAHELRLKDELDGAWAARPLSLSSDGGQNVLVLEDAGGEPLARLLGEPMDVGKVLSVAAGIAAALGNVHRRGLIHKDLKPANILVHCADGQVRLTGFGICSRLPRERQAPQIPETISGTLAYMAPEQTGRMNRSIDSRSDLYSLGVILYQMLTGVLPFAATDAMEWVHCHIARNPVPPNARSADVPPMLSRIVMKLLTKTAEERYQTAAGVERDLKRCLADWERQHRIDDFTLGEHDKPDRLVIPEKLYGREHEVGRLLAAFDRLARTGTPELVLVSGYSGIGKSSVVNELPRVLVPPRGLFASGKLDQYKRDIPYSTVVQAFQGLVWPLLGKRDAELDSWRRALLAALEPNARLITDLIPELKLIIGDPPPVPELEPHQAQRRFQLVFRRFLGVFARREHPLALFLDDLQWLDAATLDLLPELLTGSDVQYLLLIGAYRENEVDARHPLTGKLDEIRKSGARIEEIRLAPLAPEHIRQFTADALCSDRERIAPLAARVDENTGGNPFFVIQFLFALAEEGRLRFDHHAACWSWELEGIDTKRYADNVVDLMVGKLNRLPADTQQALQHFACFGNVAAVQTLSTVLDIPDAQVHAALWTALCQELVERLDGTYRFAHDRIQEAAYSLIPPAMRAEAHLRIGRLLAAQTPPEKLEDMIFEIVHQLNRGAALITQQEERDHVADLNLIAGQRARSATAYGSALTYLNTGAELLSDDGWKRRHAQRFALELNRAACEFLTGKLAKADERLAALSDRTATPVEVAQVASLRIDVCTTLDSADRAVAVCLDYLRQIGIEWPAHPADDEVRREYEHIWSVLGERTIEDLVHLPPMHDQVSLGTVNVLIKCWPAAFHTDPNLACLMTCKAVSLSLECGNCDASCTTYVMLGRIAGSRFGDYRAGFRFGQLGYELVGKRGGGRLEASTYVYYSAFVLRWMKHVRACRDVLQRAFEAANRIGDLTAAAYACNNLNSDLLFAGEPLQAVQREAESGLAFAQKTRFGLVIDIIDTQLSLVRTLRGATQRFGCLDDRQFSEARAERHLSSNPALAIAACWYWIRKLQARYMAGDHAAAMDAASRAQPLLWTSSSFFEEAEYHFYGALARAAWYDRAARSEQPQVLSSVVEHHRQLEVWAKHCPENFADRAALVGAEIARIEQREGDAMRLYEQAIHFAQESGFVHNEALANELASRFYAACGLAKVARLYLQDARYLYLRWGADGKVRQLEEQSPQLRAEAFAPGPTGTIGAPVEHLDLATVIKVSQAVSGDIVLDKLIEMVMRTAIEQAGAERGLLILPDGGELRIVAEASTDSEKFVVDLRDEPVEPLALPESVLHYVLRTQETVILDDAASHPRFARDNYIVEHGARSVLCLPLVNQGRLKGALYLENNLTTRAFTPGRITVLSLVVSQAAIALENARLYRNVAEREARIRRLVDADIIGIFVWNIDGDILEANDAFLRMLGYARDDVMLGKMRWTSLTPAEWHSVDEQATRDIMVNGRAQPYEKEYLRKDGSRVPIMIGPASFDAGGKEGVAFVLDLTARKQAEREARDSERRYREMQSELAHASRVATMGQLTASIAHEVNQPIAATVTNAQAALRWLDAQPPDFDEVRQALSRIVNEVNRTKQVIGRIRALLKKAPPTKERVDMNRAIHEVVELVHGEAIKHGITIRTQLADGLPLIDGDRVELQQVLLNLIINAIEAVSSAGDGPREVCVCDQNTETDAILVCVRDSGPGLGSESAEHLFAPFYSTKPSGLGMGLSICRSIIDAHGGRLWASANEPRGAVFQFTLPVR
ncbi:AAA family ATPase [Paraburkholderia rhizosphaerae]|uniref:histidine kinase n=1 Tax=Paraburkholderia rhizosphaerae TaxID=480658 RepID=A0A4R8L796_9BURK|nr:AAA family ATPase [Paraburkholderia rhizosphaerae]TDY38205.1 PAS domain S-box-containing protein [Paraburkholderia rhizosphaerae]